MERRQQGLTLPQIHDVDNSRNRDGFEQRVDAFLRLPENRHIIEDAREKGQDIVAAFIGTGTKLYVRENLITEVIPEEETTEEHIHDHRSFLRALKNRSHDLRIKISGPDGKKVLVKTAVLSTALLATGAYLVYKHQHENP